MREIRRAMPPAVAPAGAEPTGVPELRIRRCNALPPRAAGDFVLYWMIASRRLRWSHALDRAAGWARFLGRPLLIFEPLRCDYPWASARHHRFVVDGMAHHAAELAAGPVAYFPYLEPRPGAARGLLSALAARAAVVVTDDAPLLFLPAMVAAAARSVRVAMEAVDGNGLLPLPAADRDFVSAYQFRRFLQRTLPEHLAQPPAERPLAGRLPRFPPPAGTALPALLPEIVRRWPPALAADLAAEAAHAGGAGPLLRNLPIDQAVGPVAGVAGGGRAAAEALAAFVGRRLAQYGEGRHDPDREATSGLSPYLHWGHLSAHQLVAAVTAAEGWSPERLARTASGAREGWWGMSAAAERFLDQAVTWRELGFVMAARRPDDGGYEALPAWARATLERHRRDPRPAVYELPRLAAAATHDALWNAAQTQLLREGRIHTYLRMLWGKKVIEWSPSPRRALAALRELNDRYALDGRDPNSSSGILWCFGRYDRPWAPERPIFGTVRYMSSESARRKLRLAGYLSRYGAAAAAQPLLP